MTANESWVNQGRQSHGYFGNGTSPTDGSDAPVGTNELFRPANAAQRVDYAATSLVLHAPRNARSRWEPAVSDSARDRLKTAVATWYGASALSRDAFRNQFLDPYTSDETVDRLRSAARGMVEGQTYDDLAKAGEDLAAAAQQVGVDRWLRFIGDASHKAVEAVAQGTVPGVIKANATGTDTGQVVVLGVLALLLYFIFGGKYGAPAPYPAPSKPVILQQEEKKETQPTPEQATPAADPQSSSPGAVVSDERRTHILAGDDTGGGHGPGRNRPGKSEFPPGWSDDRIIKEIESVANDPASSHEPGYADRTVVSGTRDGIYPGAH